MTFGKREELQKPLEKVGLTVGFGNLMGDVAASLAMADCEKISSLFARVNAPKAGNVPRTPILFLYAQLASDGLLQGFSGGVQKLARATETKLLVLAAENLDQNIIKAGSVAEKPYANIIFTNNRNGAGFADFFVTMFGYMMFSGVGIGAAYNNVAWEGAEPKPWLPGTIFHMAIGDMTFPKG